MDRARIIWAAVAEGMEAARSAPDVGLALTTAEAEAAGGPDFLGEAADDWHRSWHLGYDHAIVLARESARRSL